MNKTAPIIVLLIALPLFPSQTKTQTQVPAAAAAARFDAGTISGLGARNIGSARMSGRIASIAATTVDGKTLVYVGSASGGVWKSDDGGTTFKPVFDKNPVQSIGAVAIDPSNPKTVWVGTGESWTRNSVSVGDGIYKSADGGETWTNMGLARVRADQRDRRPSEERRYRLRLRSGQALERLRRPRPVQDRATAARRGA